MSARVLHAIRMCEEPSARGRRVLTGDAASGGFASGYRFSSYLSICNILREVNCHTTVSTVGNCIQAKLCRYDESGDLL